MNTIKFILQGLGLIMVLCIIGLGITYGIEARNISAFNKALDKGVEPLKEGVYVVPFSKKKDLLVVPPLWAYNRRTMFHRFKNDEITTLVTLSGLHKPWKNASKSQMDAFSKALEKGVESDRNGIYILPFTRSYMNFSLIVIPYARRIQDDKIVCYISNEPEAYYFWEMPANDKLLSLIMSEDEIVYF